MLWDRDILILLSSERVTNYMITIDDVAKLAGTSIATVSRVVNGNYRIPTLKYEKVLKAMDELGYRPQKKQLDNKQILIISTIINERFIRCFEDSASRCNCSTLYKYIGDSDVNLDNLPSKNDFDGIIIIDALATEETYDKLRSVCPVVLCRVQYDFPNTVSVSVDDEQIAYDVVSYFIKKGRRRVAMFCDIDRNYTNGLTNHIQLGDRKRLIQGYYLALMEHGIPVEPELILTADDFEGSESAEEKFRKLFSDPEKCPDAVFSGSLAFAMTLSDIAKECGKQVPGDIAFGTCGGIFTDPPFPELTYAGQPLDRLADVTVQTLCSIVKGEIPPDKQHHIYIEHMLYRTLD